MTYQVQRRKNCKNNNLDFLEQEFHDHLKRLNLVQFQIVLIQNLKQELFADRLLDDPSDSESEDIDWVTLVIWPLIHIIGEE
jgi:hypothetical protein